MNEDPDIPSKEKLLEQYNSGMTLKKLASFYEVTVYRITIWFKFRGIKPTRDKTIPPPKKQLKDDYASGLATRALSRKYGVTISIIRKWFKQYDLKLEPNENHNKGGAPKGSNWIEAYTKEELEKAYKTPMTFDELAVHFGHSAQKIMNDFHNWGLKARGGGRIKVLSDEERLANLKKSRKNWVNRNLDKKRAYVQKSNKKRLKEDLEYRLLHNLRSRCQSVLKSTSLSKSRLVGCNGKKLREHLEAQFQEGMTWENYGYEGWHMDHIKPCASFDLSDEEEQKKCFHYTNLQPLWAKDNYAKGSKEAFDLF